LGGSHKYKTKQNKTNYLASYIDTIFICIHTSDEYSD
jgi:hypothetical protein